MATKITLNLASRGEPGAGLPAGGTTGQALVKTSATDNDVEWADSASDVGDLTTDGLTPGKVLVVDNPSGVTTLALGTAALVNTGTGATNAILGNDSRLTDPRTPIDHTHGYTDLLPESEEFAVSSSVYFDGSNNLTLTSQDSHRLRIGTDDMIGYSGVLKLGPAPTAGTVVIVWNARTDTTTVENSDDEMLGTIAPGNCGLLTSYGSFWAFAPFSQRALLTLAEISPLPIANGGVPAGGTTGQALVKTSATDNDVEWADSASDVGDLTTDGLTPGKVLVVDNPSGVTTLALGTAALADTGTGDTDVVIGNDTRLDDARTPTAHAASHAGASSTTLVPMSVVGGTGGVIVASTQTIPPGVYTAKLTNTAKATVSSGYNATLSLAGDVSWGSPGSGLSASVVNGGAQLNFSTAYWDAPEECTISLTVAAETLLYLSGSMGAEADTATFTLELVTAAGTDPITIRSDQILDGNTPGNVAKLGAGGTLPIANGGTGAATAPLALDALGGTAIGSSVFTADTKAEAQTAIGIVQITPAAYTALVTAGTVDSTTLYLLCE